MENKLRSMTDFVLHRPQCENLVAFAKERNYIRNYAEFLKRPLELGMFVPCDENGNVLKEPQKEFKYLKGSIGEDIQIEFEKAQSRVLFEGFEVIEISKNLRIIKNEKLDCQVFANQHENHYYKCLGFETIEDLVKYNLTLTNNALKIWKLNI